MALEKSLKRVSIPLKTRRAEIKPLIKNFQSQKSKIKMTDEAIEFLEKNSQVQSVLSQVEKEIEKYFSNAPLYLEVSDDDFLLLMIAVDDTVENALKKLWQFDNEWWLAHKDLADGKLCVDVMAA